MVEDFTFLLRESRPLQEDAKSPENLILIYFIVQTLYLFKSKVCLDAKVNFLTATSQKLIISAHSPFNNLPPSQIRPESMKMLFLLNFFQIQKTTF